MRGRVTDQQQAILPGVAITVTHVENGNIRETVSGEDGTFLVPGLLPGPYRVSAELAGFSRLIQEDLVLRIGTTLQVDLTMRVGAVQESLTVTAEAPQVDLTTAQVGGNVSAGEIRNLPSANGNFTSLIAILPGVVYNRASDGQSDNVTINGQPGTGVVFMLDGGSNNDDLRGGSAGAQTRPALETIQEFQVVTNQFDAEYGAALSRRRPAATAGRRRPPVRSAPLSVVPDRHGRRGPGPGVPADVGQRLLHDPVRGPVHLGGHRPGRAAPPAREPAARRPPPARTAGPAPAPARAAPASSSGRSTPSTARTSRSASALAALMAVSASLACSGRPSMRCSPHAGLHVDQRQVVPEHVVQLTRDPQSLLAGLPPAPARRAARACSAR